MTGHNGNVPRSRYAPLALMLLAVLEAAWFGRGESPSDLSTTLLLAVAATAPLALRHRYPAAVSAAVTAATIVLISTGAHVPLAVLAAQFWMLYLAAGRLPRWALALLALPYVVHAIAPLQGDRPGSAGPLVLAVSVVATLAFGDAQGRRRQAIAERDDSRRVAEASLREQELLAERARIARDLHDVVAHHVSMISVQAETARLTTEGLPEQGAQRFAEIGATARGALTEMRRLLGVLRDSELAGPPLAPQPGLGDVAALVETARAAGDDVTLTVYGPRPPLPAGVELSAYRIAQEALTNSRRHAPGAGVDVELHYTTDVVRLRVRDHGPGPGPVAADGLGLLGMQERAALVGGRLTTGAAPGGGFLVQAELPLPPATGERT